MSPTAHTLLLPTSHGDMMWSLRFFALCGVLAQAGALVLDPAPSANATTLCSDLAAGPVKTRLWSPLGVLDLEYQEAKTKYWSAVNADLTPACVVFPTSADEVSIVIAKLLLAPSVPFAVKSGGHNSNVGFASVAGGVLISLSDLASTTLSADQKTADVRPGARWREAVKALEPYGLTVVGGRIGDVGVGGFMLGGGLSFLSAQYGFACDNVVNYEVVLANASIINVNAQENTDLFFALKGGGGQFGIVTKYTLKTHPIGKIWGGVRTYSRLDETALLNATHRFVEENTDTKAAIITTTPLLLSTVLQPWTLFFFYDGIEPPPGVFAGFDNIQPLLDTAKTQSYSDLLIANDVYSPYGLRYLYRTVTMPNLPGDIGKALYNNVFQNFKNYVETAALPLTFILNLAYQPLPKLISSASAAAGGNALQLNPDEGDRMVIEIDVSWATALADDVAYPTIKTISQAIDTYTSNFSSGIPNTRSTPGNPEDTKYKPLFMNDAMADQDPVRSYGDGSYEQLKATYEKYDPDHFFATRTGGFKYV
ncbi:FAD binding domain-containing protein [Phlyctema vagabunda]|uniref:FAD binding domain-containing protein n=1 Tax=Phlyctema vagabunda TaxID=108571 RepID=A0ABR4P4V2_9HELO